MRLAILSVVCLFGICCSNPQPKSEAQEKAEAPKSYFPVAGYIKGELKLVDSLPVGIMRKVILPHRKDSAFIERSEFRMLASAFTTPDLEKEQLEAKYREQSFMDQTTGYYTMTYEPVDNSAAFRRIDVLVKPGANSDNVKSIYLEKSSLQNDTIVNERLLWKANTSFSITKEKVYKDKPPVVEQLQVIWDPSAY